MAIISMKQLLEAGVHFGHQTRRWNPKMKKYIYTDRNGIYIIDLQKTAKKLDEAYYALQEVAKDGGRVLFVGTMDSELGWCPCQGRMSDRGEVAEPGVVLHGVRQQGLRPERQVPAARGCAGAERSARSLSRGPDRKSTR